MFQNASAAVGPGLLSEVLQRVDANYLADEQIKEFQLFRGQVIRVREIPNVNNVSLRQLVQPASWIV